MNPSTRRNDPPKIQRPDRRPVTPSIPEEHNIHVDDEIGVKNFYDESKEKESNVNSGKKLKKIKKKIQRGVKDVA